MENNIKIPIKSIVEKSMVENNAEYDDFHRILLRKYFIALLNIGYLEPEDLKTMMDKFSKKIKLISLELNTDRNNLDFYMISDCKIYTYMDENDLQEEKYIISFYKAITEVIFNCESSENASLSNALCNIVAEKVNRMDNDNSKIILPYTVYENIGNKKIQIRAGYSNYNLLISLVKQLLIARGLNENSIIMKAFEQGYDNAVKELKSDTQVNLLLELLDMLFVMQMNRLVYNQTDEREKELMDQYQKVIHSMFKEQNHHYFAFIALLTDDLLRKYCLKSFEKNNS